MNEETLNIRGEVLNKTGQKTEYVIPTLITFQITHLTVEALSVDNTRVINNRF